MLVARQLLVHASLLLSTLLLPRPPQLAWMSVAFAHSSTGGSSFFWPYLALSMYSLVSHTCMHTACLLSMHGMASSQCWAIHVDKCMAVCQQKGSALLLPVG